jgi:hypothetical protein
MGLTLVRDMSAAQLEPALSLFAVDGATAGLVQNAAEQCGGQRAAACGCVRRAIQSEDGDTSRIRGEQMVDKREGRGHRTAGAAGPWLALCRALLHHRRDSIRTPARQHATTVRSVGGNQSRARQDRRRPRSIGRPPSGSTSKRTKDSRFSGDRRSTSGANSANGKPARLSL